MCKNLFFLFQTLLPSSFFRIFVYNLEQKPFVATKIRYFSKTSKFSSVKAFDLVVLFIVFSVSIIVYRVSSYIRDDAMV